MFIKIKDLELRKLIIDETIRPGIIDLGEDLEQKSSIRATGTAELIRETRSAREVVEDIRLVGNFAVQVAAHCARCLEPVENKVQESFDLLYRPQGVDARGDDASIGKAETEIGYYQGEGMLLEDVLKEQILLALPVKQICDVGCKGLCPHCGRNLNLENCDCAATVSDPRWSALEDLRKKLES